ncbi:MAG: hypothetical protein D6728_20500, partial [Cyanobacteria bacterium J055]
EISCGNRDLELGNADMRIVQEGLCLIGVEDGGSGLTADIGGLANTVTVVRFGKCGGRRKRCSERLLEKNDRNKNDSTDSICQCYRKP